MNHKNFLYGDQHISARPFSGDDEEESGDSTNDSW